MITLRHQRQAGSRHGFSVTELIVAVCIIGILAGIAITGYTGFSSDAQVTVARNMEETLNSAVHRFNESNYELVVTPVSTSTAAEIAVLRTLQYRNPLNPKVGSPYIKNQWNPVDSSSLSDYRLQWTGRLYQLILPGTAGLGLKVDFSGGDAGQPYVFPSGYKMAGS